ncbi:MAG: ThuA domain-containing protein [Gemmataceae bacterium]|nr:ThuA domain-containing protein [Gemmataceae bacterium]
MRRTLIWTSMILSLVLSNPVAAQSSKLKLLFLGDNGAHRPAERFRQLQPVLERRGIDLTYTDKAEALNAKLLASYDGLIIYANTVRITHEQEQALLDFVEGGKGFIPIHCASYCFLNSPKYVALVGAQFQKHRDGVFRATVAEPDHPIMKGYQGFESWDETYVHTKHNEKDRTVLEYRMEGNVKEPWTWVRTQGRGRVFYTAWGHDHRTWGNPGFHELIERGIRWAVAAGQDPVANATRLAKSPFNEPFPVPQIIPLPKDLKPFEYEDVGKKIPNYKGGKGATLSLMQLPVPAEESQKHIVLPNGFRAELVAADPDIRRPICMNWDERGRLWIAESVDYPHNQQPAGQGNDRLVICDDTDGDGKADKFTVFADKLSIPASFTFSHGGVIVFEGRQTVFLKDTNGDDKADERKTLFGGWSMGDTHGGASNMQYDFDNWIWGMQGYNDSRLTVGGEFHRFRQGFYRFKPDGSKLEFVRSTNNNTWGIGLSEDGLVFGSTANGNPSVYMPIPNRYYEAVKGWTPSLVLKGIADSFRFKPATDKVRQVDFHGGYTAAAGHALYTARNYPKEYWNRTAFVCEPTGHLVGTFILRREGSSFRSSNPFNLFASDDEWTAPIMAEVGPDGNVWVIDWYNFIVQHNPTPIGFKTGKGAAYETDLRDKKHGRIYRIVYESNDSAKKKPFTLANATPDQLVAALRNDNLFWRKHAQRLLVERGQLDVLPALCKLAADSNVDEIGLNVGAIHALWTMHGLGALNGKHAEATAAASAALGHKSMGVRRNAVQVLPRNPESVAAILKAGLTDDTDPLVRLAALLALADLPAAPQAGQAIVQALGQSKNTSDRWIPDAATCAAANNSEHFLGALTAQKSPNTATLAVAAVVAEHYARGGPADSIGNLVAKLADGDTVVTETVLRGLSRGWPRSKPPKLDDQMEKDLGRIATRLAPGKRGVLIQLAVSWGSRQFEKALAEVAAGLLARLQDETQKIDERVSAARELIEHQPQDKKTVLAFLEMITPRSPPELAAGLLQALQKSEASDTGALILERLAGFSPTVRAAGLGVLLSRSDWTAAFLESVQESKLSLLELSLDQKQALSQHPTDAIRQSALALLKKGGILPNADRQKVIEELLPLSKAKGDVAAGKLVFKNVCAKCHIHSGEGTAIGPDLSGVAVHSKEHLLAEIIDPSRSVEGNFRIYTVATTKGTFLTGLLAAESKTAVELFDAEGKKLTILREDIEMLTATAKSLMPDGFEKQLKPQELTDLLEFLSVRGKYLPLPLGKVATAISTKGLFYSEDAKVERLIFSDWKPKTFEGVPFHLVDPQVDKTPNVVMLYGPEGKLPPTMPKSVSLTCNAPAKAIHFLSGVSGWGYPYSEKGSVSVIVRLHYDDGQTEDHPLKNGEHFADYIRRVDVPGSKFAFNLGGRQIRYFAVQPKRPDRIERIELVKGDDITAPVVMAVTVEGPE